MSIGIEVGHSWFQIGRADYFDSFFSTVAYYIEEKKWGSKYPLIMRTMYNGEIQPIDADLAINELKDIQKRLSELSKEDHPIIWDARNMSVSPPDWAINNNSEVTTLMNYYVVNDGRDLIGILIKALEKSKDINKKLTIKSLNSESTIYS